jgi:hypothetical protein
MTVSPDAGGMGNRVDECREYGRLFGAPPGRRAQRIRKAKSVLTFYLCQTPAGSARSLHRAW